MTGSIVGVSACTQANELHYANHGRLLRALVAAVRAQEEAGLVGVELVNFAADAGSEGGRMTLDQQQPTQTEDAPKDRHIPTGALFRRRTSRVTLSETTTPTKPLRRPAKVARMLALAVPLQSATDRGLVADQAAVAPKLGPTRAQVTQLVDLLLLAPDLQLAVLGLEAVDGSESMSERALRAMAHAGSWVEQRGGVEKH